MALPPPKHELKPPTWPQGGTNSRTLVRNESFSDLVASIRQNGVLQPPGALETAELIFGFRRVAAAIEAGLELMPFLIYPSTLTPSQVRVINLTENVQRVDLSDPDLHLAAAELMKLNPDWARKDLAAHLGKSQSTVTHWLCPDDLIPEARQAFFDGKFGFTKAYAIAKQSVERQPDLLRLALSEVSRDGMERARRRTTATEVPTVRSSKLVICLANCMKVTISGSDLSLDEAIDAVKDAQREMVRGRDQGLDVKTLAAVTRDKAKAGT